jgi:hypothetical protein
MSEKSENAREIILNGCTYTVRAFFNDKTTLEEILAKRILRDLEIKKPEISAQTTCLPSETEL